MTFSTQIHERVLQVYSGSVKQACEAVGLDPLIESLYTSAFVVVTGGSVDVSIGGVTATYRVSNAPELGNLMALRRRERAVVERLLAEVLEGDVFWDVGAGIGAFSCLVGDAIGDGTVVAFEPYPPNVRRLRENLEANGIAHRVVPDALGSEMDERTLYVVDTDEPGARYGSISPEYARVDDAVTRLTVETTTADELVAGGDVPRPDVVKIDVEGAAPEVLRGMDETMTVDGPRLLVVEPHDNRDQLERMLSDRGFEIEHITTSGEPRLFAWDPAAG